MGYCVIHKEYRGGGCPRCFPPDDCPFCAAHVARAAKAEGDAHRLSEELDAKDARIAELEQYRSDWIRWKETAAKRIRELEVELDVEKRLHDRASSDHADSVTRLALLEKVAEAAKESVKNCTDCGGRGTQNEYVEGVAVAEFGCGTCGYLRAALDAAKEGG